MCRRTPRKSITAVFALPAFALFVFLAGCVTAPPPLPRVIVEPPPPPPERDWDVRLENRQAVVVNRRTGERRGMKDKRVRLVWPSMGRVTTALVSEVARHTRDEGALMSIAHIARESVSSMSDIVWAINPQRETLLDLKTAAGRDIFLRLAAAAAASCLNFGDPCDPFNDQCCPGLICATVGSVSQCAIS